MKICYLAVLIFGLGTAAFAQTNNLRGKVLYESHEGHDLEKGGVHEPEYVSLPGAYVRWSSAPENVEISDGFGFFKIVSSYLGDTLLVSMVGYQTAGLVYSGQSYVDIPLDSGVSLGSAEVTAERSNADIAFKSAQHSIVEPKGIDKSSVLQFIRSLRDQRICGCLVYRCCDGYTADPYVGARRQVQPNTS